MMKRLKKGEGGQGLLLVLLGMAVVMIMALSIISRSITDISITTKDEDSLRAFSAAEAGVEQAIIGGSLTDTLGNSSTYSASITEYFSGDNNYYYPDELTAGDVATIWFVGHNEDELLTCDDEICSTSATFNVCWGEPGMLETPAVEVTLYYDINYANPAQNALVDSGDTPNYSGVKVVRATYDNLAASRGNSFASPLSSCSELSDFEYDFDSGNIIGSTALSSSCYNSEGCLLFARVRPLYNLTEDHPIGAYLASGESFASQGDLVSSIGESNASIRKLQVIKTYEAPLAIFENGIYSVGSLTK